jgi:hypothetical protein
MRRTLAAIAMTCGIVAGCATGISPPTAAVTGWRPAAVAARAAHDAVVPGRSTRADVVARFGETQVIRFDSGYEVWVYRLEGAAPAPPRSDSDKAWRPSPAELVILFAPTGVVAKSRIRPAS